MFSNNQKQPPEVFLRKGVPRNFTKFTGKRCCQSLFFNQVAGFRSTTLLKRRLWHRCFPVNFSKFLKTLFLHNASCRLLLNNVKNSLVGAIARYDLTGSLPHYFDTTLWITVKSIYIFYKIMYYFEWVIRYFMFYSRALNLHLDLRKHV